MIGDELFKVSLTIFDTDGLEGLYVPGSQFMETVKDVGSSAMQSNMNLNEGGGYGNNIEQFAMQEEQGKAEIWYSGFLCQWKREEKEINKDINSSIIQQ